MRVAVVGSRTFKNYPLLESTLNEYEITHIVSGGAEGADKLSELYARQRNIPTTIYRPNWKLGKGAAFLRNTTIVEDSDMVVAFWDGESNGTRDSINKAKKMNKVCRVVIFK